MFGAFFSSIGGSLGGMLGGGIFSIIGRFAGKALGNYIAQQTVAAGKTALGQQFTAATNYFKAQADNFNNIFGQQKTYIDAANTARDSALGLINGDYKINNTHCCY